MRLYGVTGWKNSGKTTLVERLVTEITGRGFSVATVKHAHHGFDVDQPGKDSRRHREAGAVQVMVSSARRWALMHELRDAPEPPLAELLARLDPADLVLVEGYKRDRHPKIETRRAATAQNLIAAGDASIEAVASDAPIDGLPVPRFDLDDVSGVADFILQRVGLTRAPEAAAAAPPPLRDDCFAMPPGVAWVPVEDALERLRTGLAPVTATGTVPLAEAGGRILAAPVTALRSHPPAANAAVDGYGFAHASLGTAPHSLPLLDGRAAAGAPYGAAVASGRALRILTGAVLPEGVDTVVLEEDTARDGDTVSFGRGLSRGANTRASGEDVKAGAEILPAGHRLTPQDLGLAAATGLARLPVRGPLRVAVLSTGDEVVAPGPAETHQTFDANRPMLLEILRRWDMVPVDLGRAADTSRAVAAALARGAAEADAILTSGGASAGDEDHVSALIRARGTLQTWRIAVKPGRPLALGLWDGTPIFGLPGNPVAAFVCTLVFARPALMALAGAPWETPRGVLLPAAFSKRKKPGRREFLRARLNPEGAVEVFASEGSGRVSGLSWARGLVELEDGGREVRPGDPVRYIGFGEFGL